MKSNLQPTNPERLGKEEHSGENTLIFKWGNKINFAGVLGAGRDGSGGTVSEAGVGTDGG